VDVVCELDCGRLVRACDELGNDDLGARLMLFLPNLAPTYRRIFTAGHILQKTLPR